jgi:hypothetical protein
MNPAARPIVLGPVDTPKSWGGERWLNSTRPEGRATVAGAAGTASTTLAELLAATPALLGEWARRLYGDELPIFTKFIHTDFPPLIHVGFRRRVERAALLDWLGREQELLRTLAGALSLPSRDAFDAFQKGYAAWATEQACARWLRDDVTVLAEQLRPLTRPSATVELAAAIAELRRNRAQIVDVLNEVDLRAEEGNLLLTSAGVVHAIFGLSHQTHPLDRSRPALETLLGKLHALASAGASDDELRAHIEAAELGRLRERNRAAPPKNEAWLPATIDGRLTLVEPQQTSDTTYSLADFYTPFVWDRDRFRFRKGDPTRGLAVADVAAYLDGVDLGATALADIRRVPEPLPHASTATARLHRLVDEPARWPFFTAYRLDLDGTISAPATFASDHPPGVFQQLVPLAGELELHDAAGPVATISPRAPVFIPATLAGGYRLATTGAAKLLILSVPGARGASPHV